MGPPKRIIFISKKKFPTQKIQQFFASKYQEEYDIQLLSNLTETENLLFDPEYTLSLLVVNFRDANLFQNVRDMKNDEIFRFLPVLGIIPEATPETLSALINCGCESYLEESHLKTSLLEYMHIILVRSNYLDEVSLQVSQLQEKAIRDFILLDIIKNYIPRTIWHKAEDFAEKQRLELNSEETELIICFADICNFSTLAQYKQPKEAVEILNVVFEVATRYVFYFHGDIDKFIGDAFLAIFNDLTQAIKAIYGIQEELRERNRAKAEAGEETIEFRIGMHVGKIVRGNVGGNDRYDNTLIGDTVNTASRLEGKSPNGGFVASEAVCERLDFDIPDKYRMSSHLKGRKGEEIYYSMFDFLSDNPDVVPNLLEEVGAVQNLKGARIQKLHKNLENTDETYVI
ncbi:adenylate/guanylate cyclase domain-containing protein [Candidatus Haliotispira prima]|uniref:Adenylate/guanylate cyclase domain-containing protein n=1 Tax=Candidatus Haliotispira prima TaxID=3034016 RepID=A0ABY8MK80_9SPIO|nr:adenylate/guanylate cyclase domain-containing protein [Candidatus Haliotispira prima]